MPAETKIGVIGLGYVGLPLAVEFAGHFPTVGFDINKARVEQLTGGIDSTLEVEANDLAHAEQLLFSHDEATLQDCNIYIVTVPTPIDEYQRPDLRPLKSASRLLGRIIETGDIAIFESTVYPGCTEEACVPIIEEVSGLRFNKDFFAGYSPERINPGDKEHRVSNIVKITSGSTPEIADRVDALYRTIVTAGTHRTSSIKVAEAAKVIENTQRDVNIALVNELSLLFNMLQIDTLEILEAAGSKWNFLPFRPGLVGGHCISVDPYYLTHKAQEVGYHPEVILSGRRINDGMGQHVSECVIKMMTQKRIHVVDSCILVMGLAFKENCPDLRNSGVGGIIDSLRSYNARVHVYDPWVDKEEAEEKYNISVIEEPKEHYYDAIILCVAHDQFKQMGAAGIRRLGADPHILYDVKYVLDKNDVDDRL
ncbi:MAG: nucleotide sugar dehydrogenase [Pseudomonadales bacterium]